MASAIGFAHLLLAGETLGTAAALGLIHAHGWSAGAVRSVLAGYSNSGARNAWRAACIARGPPTSSVSN